MPVNRRRLLQSLALGAAPQSSPPPQPAPPSFEALRHVAAAHGADLSAERLRAIQPAVELRLQQLETLRRVDLPDSIAPAPSLLP